MKYHNITKNDMLNGDGLRVVLWVSGCSHNCPECQNPITHNPNDGLLFDKNAKNEIFEQLAEDYIDGITFSGGDPLHEANRKDVLDLILEIRDKFPTKTIWLYTGYTYDKLSHLHDAVIDKILNNINVLLDGPFIKDKSFKYNPDAQQKDWVGSCNQNVIHLR